MIEHYKEGEQFLVHVCKRNLHQTIYVLIPNNREQFLPCPFLVVRLPDKEAGGEGSGEKIKEWGNSVNKNVLAEG